MTERIYLSSRARAIIIWVAVAITLFFLWEVRGILTPFVWAIVTAYVLNSAVVFLARKTGMSRRLWAVLLYVVLLGLLVWGLGTLVPLLSQQLADFLKEAPRHVREAGKLLREAGIINSNVIDVLGTQINFNASDADLSKQLSSLVAQELGRSALPALTRGFESVLKLLVYLVSTFFLLLEMERIGDTIARLTPPAARTELGPWVRRVNYVLSAYIRGQLILVVLMSVTSYIALTILDVRYAPLLAIFTGLVETMPFIGPYIAGGTAVLVALTQGHAPYDWSPVVLALAVAATYTVLRQLEDNFVMPFLIGRLVHLHPLAVIFSVLSGAALGGILGLLLAVPAAATVKIVATYLYGKLNEEPPRTSVFIEHADTWNEVIERIREAVLFSKANGASRPYLLISVPSPPAFLLDKAGFLRFESLLDESRADAILHTSNPALIELAAQSGIRTKPEPEPPSTQAPEPDYEEAHVTGLLTRIRKAPEDTEGSKRRLFNTRPLTPNQKELDEDHPV